MLTSNQKKKLQQFFAQKPVLKAYIFGSVSRNEADSESDVDILVDLDYSQPLGLGFIQMQIDLSELLQKKVDLISSGGLSKHIKPIIEAEKKLIYAR